MCGSWWGQSENENKNVRVTFLVDRAWVCDGEEAGVDVEEGVFSDGGLAGG